MRILFIEPPKEFWFVMGEYMPPPLGLLQLAAYLESREANWDIELLDCQADNVSWNKLPSCIESANPDVVLVSSLATCNSYTVLRTLSIVKQINPDIVTIVGGQHFTALAQESLEEYSEIDFIIRGEGELTLWELLNTIKHDNHLHRVRGISYRIEGKVVHNPPRPFIENLNDLPFPAYHLIEGNMSKYHFRMMAGSASGYALVEASRGCPYKCNFCSQWKFWGERKRTKSPIRIADEMENLYHEYGISFLWLTDDNLGMGRTARGLCEELISRGLSEEISWFLQARSDDIIHHQDLLPRLRKAGNYWIMAGLESHDNQTLQEFNKSIQAQDSKKAMDLLKEADIFAQATLIIGSRHDSHQTIEKFREYVNYVDPDLAIFMILTPFPGTPLYDKARERGWIEDFNWSKYDMVHAVMPTKYLTRQELQEELYLCYRDFYGNIWRRFRGIFSGNKFKRQTYRYMAGQGLLQSLRDLF